MKKTIRLVLTKHAKYGYDSYRLADDDLSEYTVLSAPIDVEFELLDSDQLRARNVLVLEALKEDAINNHAREVARLQKKINEVEHGG